MCKSDFGWKVFFSKEVLIIKVISIKNMSVILKQQHHYCVLCEAAAATDAKFSSFGLMRTPNWVHKLCWPADCWNSCGNPFTY